jgi:hypothetical protein
MAQVGKYCELRPDNLLQPRPLAGNSQRDEHRPRLPDSTVDVPATS